MMKRMIGVGLLGLGVVTASAQAADWSDTYVGYRTGTKFAEPFNNQDIRKDILTLSHANGYRYGSNFVSIDYLMSDSKDPSAKGSSDGAREFYLVYRHTLDLGKVTGNSFKMGPIRGLGFTAGFDANAKTDAGYNSKKQMLVAGPTLMFDVPGFLDVSLLQLWESNAPFNTYSGISTPRYRYDPHPMLSAAWGIALGKSGFSFEGYANWIAAKGLDEFGGGTKPETNIDTQIMFDASGFAGLKPKTFKVGLQYQYWRNKFGNDHEGPAGEGAFAKTPMIRTQFHF
jgi:hypothetical protein